MKIPELLAPAGSRESLKGAIMSGCDAVYLGGRRFNARQGADNFGEDELEEIIDYCHVRGVKTYITINTLYGDNEIRDVSKFCEKAYKAGADAFIMQDIGTAFLIRKNLPDIKLMASTQMTIGDYLGVGMLSKIFDRIIISRESSLEDLRRIISTCKTEIEIFVHGALCVCHSGQCLMSSMLGGRSGNRGLCAQPCRLKYELIKSGTSEAEGYLLSPRDLCTLEILPEIVSTGVSSLKIEGRMKNPEYVTLTTRLYRERLDCIASGNTQLDSNATDKLLRIFNRGGAFTQGYFKKHGGADMMSIATSKNTGVYIGNIESSRPASKKAMFRTNRDLAPGDGIEVWTKIGPHTGTYINKEFKAGERAVIEIEGRISSGDKVYLNYDKRLIDEIHAYRDDFGKIAIDAKVIAKKGNPIRLELKHGNLKIATEGDICEPAEKRPMSTEEITARLSKTGETTFTFNFTDVHADDGIYISIKALNELRRQATQVLTKAIIESGKRKAPEISTKHSSNDTRNDKSEKGASYFSESGIFKETNKRPALSVLCGSLDQLVKVIDALLSNSGIDAGDSIIFEAYDTPSNEVKELLANARKAGLRVYAALPRVISGDGCLYSKYLDALPQLDGFLLRNFGQLKYMTEHYKGASEAFLISDFGFNSLNAMSTAALRGLGFTNVTMSPELTLNQLCRIASRNTEVIIHGRLPLMVTNQCPIGNQFENRRKYCPNRGNSSGYTLKDSLGLEFPILTDCQNCVAQIFNSKPIFTLNKLDEIMSCNAGVYRLCFSTESPDHAAEITLAYKVALNHEIISEGLEHKIRDIYDMGVTNGHFFRGVSL